LPDLSRTNLSTPIFSAEKRIVFAGKDFHRFFIRPGLEKFIARANDGNLAFIAVLARERRVFAEVAPKLIPAVLS
jgi:hypothetical protein